MTIVFHTYTYIRFIEIKSKKGERNFIELVNAPIFMEAVLAIEICKSPSPI